MKVVVRTFGRDASVADWLTKFFQIITVPPSLVDVDTVMVVSWRGAAPERLIRLQSDCWQLRVFRVARAVLAIPGTCPNCRC